MREIKGEPEKVPLFVSPTRLLKPECILWGQSIFFGVKLIHLSSNGEPKQFLWFYFLIRLFANDFLAASIFPCIVINDTPLPVYKLQMLVHTIFFLAAKIVFSLIAILSFIRIY